MTKNWDTGLYVWRNQAYYRVFQDCLTRWACQTAEQEAYDHYYREEYAKEYARELERAERLAQAIEDGYGRDW